MFLGCAREEPGNTPPGSRYQISIVDSLVIDYVGSLQFMQKHPSDDRLLFFDRIQYAIVEVGLDGSVISAFSVVGNDDKEAGGVIAAVGYAKEENGFRVVTERGVFLFNRAGEIQQRSLLPRNWMDRVYLNLLEFRKKDSLMLAYVGEPSTIIGDEMILPGDKRYRQYFRLMTIHNLENNQTYLRIPYHESSLFKKNPTKKFDNLQFFLRENKDTLYCLINPDQRLYRYAISNDFDLIDVIELKPDPSLFPEYQRYTSIGESMSRNSSYKGIVVDDRLVLLSYKAGLTEDIYKAGIKSSKDQERYFTSVYDKRGRKRSSGDVLLPYKVTRLSCHLRSNLYLATTNKTRVERLNNEVFYICKLEEPGK